MKQLEGLSNYILIIIAPLYSLHCRRQQPLQCTLQQTAADLPKLGSYYTTNNKSDKADQVDMLGKLYLLRRRITPMCVQRMTLQKGPHAFLLRCCSRHLQQLSHAMV